MPARSNAQGDKYLADQEWLVGLENAKPRICCADRPAGIDANGQRWHWSSTQELK